MSKVYEIVQKQILDRLKTAIETGEEFQWIKPWKGCIRPQNFISKEPYKGVNLLLLPFGGYYLTMNQVKTLGGKVIKGSKSFQVVFWKKLQSDTEENEEREDKPTFVFRYYNVFHQSQVEGIDFGNDEVEASEETLLAEVEELIQGYSKEVCKIRVMNSNEAYYAPSLDEIVVPESSQYEDIEAYYGTIFHEMVHSTGHPSRLNRFKENSSKFGSEDYSKEELVAEIGACMLRCQYSIMEDTSNSIAYLKGWYNQIKNGAVSDIVVAAQQSQKATDFILNSVALLKDEKLKQTV